MPLSGRSLFATCAVALLFTTSAISQKVTPRSAQDESTRSLKPANPPRVYGKSGAEEGEGDDATARMLAQRKEIGVPTPEYKRKLLQERAKRQSNEKAARRNGFGASPVTGPTWIPIGPEGADYEINGVTGFVRDSGRARKFLPHPTDPDTLYFLTSGGGLWVTHNFTSPNTTWVPLTDNLPTTAGGSMAFGRTPNVIYLGLGDPFDLVNIGGAMVTSTDGGQTWSTPVDLGPSLSVRDIYVDSSGPQDVVLVATDTGLYRSTDSGATYTLIPVNGLSSGQVIWSIVSTSAGLVLNAQPCATTGDFCGFVSGLYYSTDIGATWNAIPNSGGVFAAAGRATLAVGAPGDKTVYAFAEKSNSSDQLDLFTSTDGGLDWTALGLNAKIPTNPSVDNANMDLMHGQSWYNQMILVDPRDIGRNTVYLGGNLSSAKTTDGGVTWTLVSDWLPFQGRAPLPYVHADFHTAAISLAGTPTLLFGSDGGIFVSTDDGATWSSDKNNGLQTHLIYSISSTPGFPSNVIGGFQDNGTRSRKGNTTIYNQSLGGDGIAATWDQGSTNMSLTTLPGNSYGANLTNQTPDLIASWFRFGVSTTGGSLFYTPITIPNPSLDPTGKIFYTSSAGRISKVNLGSNPISAMTIGLVGSTITPTVSIRSSAHGLGVSPVDLLHIGVPATGGHVEITSNGGASWTDLSMNTLVSGFQSSMQSVTWVDNSTIFVTSVAPFAGAIRVAKSIDGGASWTGITGLPDVQVERIIVDNRDATKQSFFAATYAGVYHSTDGGATWASYGTGLPSVSVRDIYMPPDGSFLRIATYGRGFWELPSLSYVTSTLVDDVSSCNHDGWLGNGETGTLSITLHNDSSTTLNSISATITSTNPAISFPGGNTVSFPSAGPNSDANASITVSLNGAVGIQQADFTIAYTDPTLGLPAPATALASYRVNAREIPNSSANDDFEANNSAWTVTGVAESLPDTLNWKRVQINPLQHRWLEVDSNAPTDQSLISPVMQVGNGNFSFSFQHRFGFEAGGGLFFDGMVLEISTDGGATWTDIGTSAVPGYIGTLALGGGNVIEGRQAYVGRSTNYPVPFIPVTVNLGTTYAGQNVQIRFRVGTDSNGFAPGVELQNFTTTGLANTPFPSLVADTGICPTTTTVSSNLNPSNFGDTVTFGATVSGGLTTASGTVNFQDGASVIGSGTLDGSGQTTFATSALSGGSHAITANYVGDTTHANSASAPLTQVVARLSTSTTVVSTLNPSVFGQNVTFNATVSAASGSPTGTISFNDGASTLATVPVAAGGASFSTTLLSVGPHSITANYSGDANYLAGSSAPVSQVVKQATSTVTLGTSANPAAYSQTVNLTATITPQFGGTATGTVTFFDGVTSLGTFPVSGNAAVNSVSNFTVGTHMLKATYSGDTNVGAGLSLNVNQKVVKAKTTTALMSSANPALVGQSVTYTATIVPVAPALGSPTGTVTFKQGSTTVATVPLSGGTATFTTSYAAAATMSIKAVYSGDSNFLTSSSAFLTEVVKRYAVTLGLTSDVNPSVLGQTVTFTATLSTAGPSLDGQVVTFKTFTTILGTGTISGGVATLATSALNTGKLKITASYAGDTAHTAVNAAITQTVTH